MYLHDFHHFHLLGFILSSRSMFMLTVIRCLMHHLLEGSRSVDISRARNASNIFIDVRSTAKCKLGKKSLFSKNLFRF